MIDIEGPPIYWDPDFPIVIPPLEPLPGEADPGGEITLPDGSVVDATAVIAAIAGAKQIAWQGAPWSCLWIVRTDGLLVSFTYDKDEDVWAFARHPKENGACVSIAVIPSATSGEDELWTAWQREIDSNVRCFIERQTPRVTPATPADKSRYCFLDSAVSYAGAPQNSFTGAGHLAGMTVRGWADGADVKGIEIADDGSFNLPDGIEASVLHVGIHSRSSLVSLPTARLATERQNIASVTLRFKDTFGGRVGRTLDDLEDLQVRSMTAPMDDTPALVTGDMEVNLQGSYDDYGIYVVDQDQPGPMTILAAFPTYVAAGG